MRKKSIFMSMLLMSLAIVLPIRSDADTLFGDYLKEKGVEVAVSGTVDFYDKYVWRGFLLDDDHVLQPSFTISVAGFQGGFWGSWDVENEDALTSNETDGWIGYANNFGFINENLQMVNFKFGHTWYGFPGYSTYTTESYLGLSLATFLNPYFTWYHDYGNEAHGGADGDYFMIGVGQNVTLCEKYGIVLSLGQEIGFNKDAFIVGDGGYSLTSVGVTIPLTDHASVTPKVAYSVPWGDLENDTGNGGINVQKEQVYGGVSVAYNF